MTCPKILPASMFLLAALVGSPLLAAEPDWARKSSETGDLPIPNQGDQQTCCVSGDFDKDGILDFVVGERTATPSVVWYRRVRGKWEKLVIDDTALRPEAGGVVADVDGDGDQDLILGQDSRGPAIWWWENPCPQFDRPWKRREIKNSGSRQHHDQTVADYDGDGRDEFVTWNQKGKVLLLFEIPTNPRKAGPWPCTEIFRWDDTPNLEGFPSRPVDIDLDGQVDIVGGGRWFKHEGGTKFEPQVIDESMRFTQCAAGQLVPGGRPEVVFSPGDADGVAKWYQYEDGQWKGRELAYVRHGHTCDVGDIDGDGNLDIFLGEMGDPGAGDEAQVLVWYGNGKGKFRKEVVSEGLGIHEGLLDDFDGDGDLDILHKPYHHKAPRLDVLLNQGG